MIKVRGMKYFNDNNTPTFIETFDSLKDLESWIKETTIKKDKVESPAMKDGKLFYPTSFSSRLRFPFEDTRYGFAYICITQIESSNGILFSSGDITGDDGFVGIAAQEMFDRLENWKSSSNYVNYPDSKTVKANKAVNTLEDILQEYFNCENPFLDAPYYDEEKKAPVVFTDEGVEAYGNLIRLLYDVENLTERSVDGIVEELDSITSER